MKRIKHRNLNEICRETTHYIVEWDSKTGCSARRPVTKATKTTGGSNVKGNATEVQVKDKGSQSVQVGLGTPNGSGQTPRVQGTPRAGGKGLPEKPLKRQRKPLIPEWKPKQGSTKKRRKSKKLKNY